MAAAVETRDLTRSFGTEKALDSLSFDVEAGEVVALLGPNGAGKTTTVRLLNGLLRPDAGTARVLGLDPTADGTELRRRTGVMTEQSGLDERLTALENVAFTARIRGLRAADAATQSAVLLERFGIASRAHDRVQGFSTGQRKRVALARALLHDPEVLFLDEPTAGLDPEATRDVLDLLASLAAERGRTVLLCTHFLGEAGRLCQRMAVLHRGRLRAFGRPDELAARLWRGVPVELDLGAAADERTLAALRAGRGVLSAEATSNGARVQLEERAALPPLVATLVQMEVPVYGAVPRPPTIEEIYFAIQERAE
jgi:ABC-2 type transport system ATP-binding protein